MMRCERWKELAYPYVEGTLGGESERAFSAHLRECAVCRGEVAASRTLQRALSSLPDPPLTAAEAQSIDAAVMARLRSEWAAQPAVQVAGAGVGDRQLAARTVSVAARRRERRRFEPLFAPIPSLIALLLVALSGLIGLAVVFGDVLSRGMGGTLNLAAQSIWSRTNWLAQELIGRVIDLITLVDVARRMFSQARPWLDAWNLLLMTHGQELLITSGVATAIVAAVVWRVRRQRRTPRTAIHSS